MWWVQQDFVHVVDMTRQTWDMAIWKQSRVIKLLVVVSKTQHDERWSSEQKQLVATTVSPLALFELWTFEYQFAKCFSMIPMICNELPAQYLVYGSHWVLKTCTDDWLKMHTYFTKKKPSGIWTLQAYRPYKAHAAHVVVLTTSSANRVLFSFPLVGRVQSGATTEAKRHFTFFVWLRTLGQTRGPSDWNCWRFCLKVWMLWGRRMNVPICGIGMWTAWYISSIWWLEAICTW